MKPFLSAILGVMLMSQQVKAEPVQVEINNIDPTRSGVLRVILFAQEGFPKKHDKALSIQSIRVNQTTVKVVFLSVPERFAIKVLHDENEDGKVTKNWTGLWPKEGLGFSNGARIRFGPPSFDSARIERKTITTPVSLSMIYP